MKTQYCSGRQKLPAPSLSVISGNIQGTGNCYFWLKARNRAGYNIVSNVTNLNVTTNKAIVVASSNFTTYSYEDWLEIILCFNTINDFDTSRVIYKQNLYEEDQLTPVTLGAVTINSDYAINEEPEVDDIDSLPVISGLPNGYRLRILSVNKVYEFAVDTEKTPDDITVIEKSNGYWLLVPSDSLTETTSNYRKELFEVSSDELLSAPLATISQPQVPLKYAIYNDTGVAQSDLQLQLNEYCSDSSIDFNFVITLLGYFSYGSETLDISGIDYVNVSVTYPNITIKLNKPLPNGSALVFELLPDIVSTDVLPEGVFISVYPKLSSYLTVDKVYYWSDPVETIADLRAIPSTLIIDNQVRRVISVDSYYAYDTESTASDNGSSVVKPNFNPAAGRWLVNASTVPDGSITPAKLSSGTLALINGGIETNTVSLDTSVNYAINLDSVTTDYLILITPTEDGDSTVINVTATLANNTTKSIVLELRQRSGTVEFDSSIIFPGGSLPQLSGTNKNDLFVIILTKDSSGVTKKRGYLVQKDIG